VLNILDAVKHGATMKEIQEERIRGYFITAAKELIRGEGLVVVSARNVAERAGYSYATLYNYFKDIRDLIFSCVEDFLKECEVFIEGYVANTEKGIGHLKAVSCGYCNFFIQYPGIYDLLFHQKVSIISTNNSKFEKIAGFFSGLTNEDWQMIGELQAVTSGYDISKRMKTHSYAIHGLLLFYLNNREVIEYAGVIQTVNDITERAIGAA
jgi:AcrR family transcriptional regulator